MVCVFNHYFQLIKQHDLTLTLDLSYPTLSGSPGLPGKVAAGWREGSSLWSRASWQPSAGSQGNAGHEQLGQQQHRSTGRQSKGRIKKKKPEPDSRGGREWCSLKGSWESSCTGGWRGWREAAGQMNESRKDGVWKSHEGEAKSYLAQDQVSSRSNV